MSKRLACFNALALLLALCSCGKSAAPQPQPQPSAVTPIVLTKPVPQPLAADGLPLETPHARLPKDEGPHYPSLARTVDAKPVDAEALADVRQCGACHQE